MSTAAPTDARVPQSTFTRLQLAWLGLRNRLVASPEFQRRAASLPFVRRIAARRARALFDLCAGFVYSQVLLACVRLSLFERLASGPAELGVLATQLGLTPEATDRLVRAAASLRLVRQLPDGRVALDDLGAALRGNPSIEAFIEHHALLYEDLRDPVALLRGQMQTRLSGFWPYGAAEDPAAREAFADYSTLMARTQALVARDILDSYDFGAHLTLLDIGGGEGAFLAAVAERHPHLALGLFDLPQVAARARDQLATQGLAERIAISAGSFLEDPLPAGADIITLVRVVHDHEDATVRVLLRRIFETLPRGGSLLLAEPMAGTSGAEPVGDAYFGFYLLAMGRGRPRRPAELEALLREAGFSKIQTLHTRRPLITGAMLALKT